VTTAPSLADRVLATIRRRGLLRGGETVLVAVSGGADSVALLDLLCLLRPALSLVLHGLHVHHGLRSDADADAEFARGLGERLDVPVHVTPVRIRRLPDAGAAWQGLEAEARRLRYRAFAEGARAVGASRVATAHTADDQAETVLMRLLAGAGPRGLAGIPPERGIYVRPLIDTRRTEIEAHLRARGLGWREDPSNQDRSFTRNRIRREVLPFLAERYDHQVVAALCRAADGARDAVRALDAAAAAALARIGRRGSCGWVLATADLEPLGAEGAAGVLIEAAASLGERGPLRGWVHRAVRGILASGGERRLRLGSLVVERSGRWLRVGPARLPPLGARAWPAPGRLDLPEIDAVLEARLVPAGPGYRWPDGRAAAAFDAAALPGLLGVRGRRPGDRLAPFGAGGERRVKSLLIDAGVPRWERDRLVLLEGGGEILWLAGVRRGRAAPVTAETTRILEVTLHSPLVERRARQ
jgi:tRNA(Ile)-lysidine synthase